MASSSTLPAFQYIFLSLIFASIVQFGVNGDDKQVYIVYMGSLPTTNTFSQSLHLNVLKQVISGRPPIDSIVRSYTRSFNGFAAKLTSQEAAEISGRDGVVSVFPNKVLHLHTTKSWSFMGLNENAKRVKQVESDLIIGVFDEGIVPESPSFNDEGFGPPPKKWKGKCNGGQNFTCNKKIIGARFYDIAKNAKADTGHGSHTASIAGGRSVPGVNFFGLANGTAHGGVPSARIAVYKVCTDNKCSYASLLAAFDDAIADGVDVITCSFGMGVEVTAWGEDALALGAFHAMEKGILTVNSAGNDGWNEGTTSSTAPWIMTVAASDIDRRIIDKVALGNGKVLTGFGVNHFTLNGTMLPLSYGDGSASSECVNGNAQSCGQNCLDEKKVKGKIVLCDPSFVSPFIEPLRAGAAGAIAFPMEESGFSEVDPLPASTLQTQQDYETLMAYYSSTKNATATILTSEVVKDGEAPAIAPFSSRGPNRVSFEILKPDITAPGVEILAATSPEFPPSNIILDKTKTNYTFMSGTSMSCPHVTGAAVYVKSFHPDWSPSAIKSALMTTAWPMNETHHRQGEFAYGAGHLNPINATDPGLVYECTTDDYLAMLCTMNITSYGKCPPNIKLTSPKDLNLPSMAAQVKPNKTFEVKFSRSVTNVGTPNSTYKATISASHVGVEFSVEPSVLAFKSLNEKHGFVVSVVGKQLAKNSMVSASLVWSDGVHKVRSPVVVFTDLGPQPAGL